MVDSENNKMSSLDFSLLNSSRIYIKTISSNVHAFDFLVL